MRCDFCGRDQENVRKYENFWCAPPYKAQPHCFSGRHPADIREASLTLRHIAEVNKRRCEAWHQGDKPWTIERWITATVGEHGELTEVVLTAAVGMALGRLANDAKKLFRAEDGSVGILKGETIESLRAKIAKEWADVMLYMILLATYSKIDMDGSIRSVFNAKSEQLGFEERL